MATGRGELGGPFKGARRRRRRPTATDDGEGKLGLEGEKSIRIDLESVDFQTKMTGVSIREKEEEISKIISPQKIRPEKERRGRIGKRRRTARLGFGRWPARGRRRVRQVGPTCQRQRARTRAAAAADWADLGRGRERRFWADFRPKAKRDF